MQKTKLMITQRRNQQQTTTKYMVIQNGYQNIIDHRVHSEILQEKIMVFINKTK